MAAVSQARPKPPPNRNPQQVRYFSCRGILLFQYGMSCDLQRGYNNTEGPELSRFVSSPCVPCFLGVPQPEGTLGSAHLLRGRGRWK